MYKINIKTIWKHSKNVEARMKAELEEALLSCSNFKELRGVFKENSLVLKDILDISLFPESIRERCDLMAAIRNNTEHEIKIVPVKRGMFIKIDVML